MSDPRLDALAESARNRGLKLVRSRVRTKGKRRFGKVGLTDLSRKPVFGMDSKGPIASPEAVQDYLRSLEAKDWGASLDVSRGSKSISPRQAPSDRAPKSGKGRIAVPSQPTLAPKPGQRLKSELKPAPKPKGKLEPEAQPKPQIRSAKGSDAARLAELIHELGHEIDEKHVRKNLAALKESGETPLVATLGRDVVGMCGIGRRIVIHRSAPLGRITALVVAHDRQGRGIGRMLVEAAQNWMRKEGCKLVEVTSNDRRTAAHAFYRHLGFERSSIRFFKEL